MRQQVVSTTKVPSGYVWISTCLTPDHGWETMVFQCDAQGEVLDWLDMEADRYVEESEAQDGHASMVSRWSL
jgi:hypothetical protein